MSLIIGMAGRNLHGMPQHPSVNGFEWVEATSQFKEDFMKSYNKARDESHFRGWCSTSWKIAWHLQWFNILSERLKIVKVVKLVAKIHCKTEYVIQIRNLKQALNHELVLKKVGYRVIKFMQKALIKSDEYWLRQSSKNDFLN